MTFSVVPQFEIVQMADSYMPKLGKRGPYKKRTEECHG
jgi:hypothetical protein